MKHDYISTICGLVAFATWAREISTASKTSRNVVSSSLLDRMGKIAYGKGNASIQHNSMPAPAPNRKLYNPPQDLNDHFDTSDSEDCESVGSNSPKLEGANETHANQKSAKVEESTPKSPIHSNNNIYIREDPDNIHVGTKIVRNPITKKRGDEGKHGPTSIIPNSKNASNVVIPNKTNLSISNNTCDMRSNKHLQVGGIENGTDSHIQDMLNKVTKTNNTNYSSTRNGLKDSRIVQTTKAKKYNNDIRLKLNDTINFDEGDGGGSPYTNNESIISQYKNNTSHLNQNQTQEDQEAFDEGDGGGFDSSSHTSPGRRRHKRHGTRSCRRSRESKRESSRGRGGSHQRSQEGSQQSSIHSRRKKAHQRVSRGGSHRSSSKSSRHSDCNSTTSWRDDCGLSLLSETKPYPAKWRCFGRRPPAIHEFRPIGEGRVKNVRPAGKPGYLMRNADEKHGCRGPDASDAWDVCYGVAKPIGDQWSTPLPYGTQVIRAGDIDPYCRPSRGDLVIINPAQNFYRAMKSGYVITYHGQDYSFGIGDLIVRLGRFMPNGKYIPYGNLELYMYTQTREMRLLGCQPFLLVDFNYHNLDYESPGKHLAIGTFLNESFFPRRGDIIIHGGAWAENYPNIQHKHHSSVKYWRPRMEFLPNDMLLRPYVDIGCKCDASGRNFYWGAAELYTYSGKGLAWAYWGRDHHICDTPYPQEQEHGIKTRNHKKEVGHYGDGLQPTYGGGYFHGHQSNDGCHSEHKLSNRHHRLQHRLQSHHANDDCHSQYGLSRHSKH